jgi:hypothetical protein
MVLPPVWGVARDGRYAVRTRSIARRVADAEVPVWVKPPVRDRLCGIYVMESADVSATMNPSGKRWPDDVAGQVQLHGRVRPGPPPPVGFIGEYRSALDLPDGTLKDMTMGAAAFGFSDPEGAARG